jgi:hypothetical protein
MSWVPKTLEDRNTVLFAKLVPASGKCDTVEGEMLRAINRMIYRYYNDGDFWFEGYGCKTAGPAEAYLRTFVPFVYDELVASEFGGEENYATQLNIMLEKILDYVESRKEYTPNGIDMLQCESKYEDETQKEYDENW